MSDSTPNSPSGNGGNGNSSTANPLLLPAAFRSLFGLNSPTSPTPSSPPDFFKTLPRSPSLPTNAPSSVPIPGTALSSLLRALSAGSPPNLAPKRQPVQAVPHPDSFSLPDPFAAIRNSPQPAWASLPDLNRRLVQAQNEIDPFEPFTGPTHLKALHAQNMLDQANRQVQNERVAARRQDEILRQEQSKADQFAYASTGLFPGPDDDPTDHYLYNGGQKPTAELAREQYRQRLGNGRHINVFFDGLHQVASSPILGPLSIQQGLSNIPQDERITGLPPDKLAQMSRELGKRGLSALSKTDVPFVAQLAGMAAADDPIEALQSIGNDTLLHWAGIPAQKLLGAVQGAWKSTIGKHIPQTAEQALNALQGPSFGGAQRKAFAQMLNRNLGRFSHGGSGEDDNFFETLPGRLLKEPADHALEHLEGGRDGQNERRTGGESFSDPFETLFLANGKRALTPDVLKRLMPSPNRTAVSKSRQPYIPLDLDRLFGIPKPQSPPARPTAPQPFDLRKYLNP
jgi:hypothetical protein